VARYLGIDIGTSGCRSCVIDADARPRAHAAVSLPPPRQSGAEVEQDPRLWQAALAANLDQLKARTPLAAVEAIAIDGTSGTLLCCDSEGVPLTQGLMYNDARAVGQARQIADTAPGSSAAHGASSSLAKLLYLLGRPAAAGIRYALHQADWLTGTLCGSYGITDENNALKLGYDPVKRRWPDWLATLGVPAGLLPRVVPPGTPVGTLAPSWCARWGFSPETRLVSGTTDSTAACIATGAREGEAVTSLGSTLVLKVHAGQPVVAPQYGVYSHRLGDHWLVGGASNSGGAVLRQYFTRQAIDDMSSRIQPEHPTRLDYYPLPATGERFPVSDPDLEPRLEPRPADDIVFFQGILEGIAAIERRGYRLLEALGAPYPERVFTVGGGSVNVAWRTIRETLLGVPVLVATHQEAAYGAALLAKQGMESGNTPR